MYYRPEPVSADDLSLMRLLDEPHLERPFLGSRRLQDALEDRGIRVDPSIARGLLIWTEAWAVENRGGKRVGAGRKPKSQAAKKLK